MDEGHLRDVARCPRLARLPPVPTGLRPQPPSRASAWLAVCFRVGQSPPLQVLVKEHGRSTEPSTIEGSGRESRPPSSDQCREEGNLGEPPEGTESLSPTLDNRVLPPTKADRQGLRAGDTLVHPTAIAPSRTTRQGALGLPRNATRVSVT